MFDQYSYKFKLKALVLIFVLLSIAAYRRSFGPLINVIKENIELNQKRKSKNLGTINLNSLQQDIIHLNKLIGKGGYEKEKIQNEIIGFVSTYDKGVSLNHLKSIHEFSDESYYIYSYQLDLVGDVNGLLGILYQFEKAFSYSKVVSSTFYTLKQNTKKNTLHLSIIFQNYENKK